MKKKETSVLIIFLVLLIFVLFAFLLVSLGTLTLIGSNENQIEFYSLESADIYITQVEIDDLTANDWMWAKSMGYCIGSGTEMDPYIIGNDTFSYPSGDGLVIKNSRKYFKVMNSTFKDSPNAGFLLNNVTNGLLINNSFFDNNHGIRIYKSWDVNLTKSTFNRNTQYNLNLEQSDNIKMLLNTFTGEDGSDTGIRLSYSDNNLIANNTFSKLYSGPIGLEYSNFNDIIENNFSSPILQGNGVNVFVSHNNNISKNVMINCRRGVSLANSDYNVFSDNFVEETDQGGVETHHSEYNTITNNIFNDVGQLYIGVNSYFNQILNNNISNNIWYGISVVDSDDNIVLNNYLNNNTIGIRVYFGSERNNFSGNVIRNTIEKEFLIYSNSHFNYVFNNTFVGNGLPAEDNSTNNFWDNGVIGNSWDNYIGTDLDDDGIGDTPYNITGTMGSQDRYPIYSDGDDAPQITINAPNNNDLMGKKAPTFDIKITVQTLNSTWYRLWNGTKLTANSTFEYLIDNEIEQNIWNEVGNGTVTITFFANDSRGKISYKNVTVRKDIHTPNITINKPMEGDLFGIKNPSADEFNITFEDPNSIDYKWYMLSNESYYTDNHTWNGYIEQQFWDEIFNGTIKIKIFANDSAGNVGFAEISVEKDIRIPEILIKHPINNQVFSSNAPNFIVEIRDPHLVTMWYTLNGGKNIIFTANGTIDPTEWNTLIDGPVIITFYANNSLGNIHYKSVDIIKETNSPIINIISPNMDQVYGYIAPNFNVTITDQTAINTSWYTIDNGATNYTFSGLTGVINQTAWNKKGSELTTIRFYANDSLGNKGTKSVVVTKNIPSAPAISGYNVLLLIGVISLISAISIKKQK